MAEYRLMMVYGEQSTLLTDERAHEHVELKNYDSKEISNRNKIVVYRRGNGCKFKYLVFSSDKINTIQEFKWVTSDTTF